MISNTLAVEFALVSLGIGSAIPLVLRSISLKFTGRLRKDDTVTDPLTPNEPWLEVESVYFWGIKLKGANGSEVYLRLSEEARLIRRNLPALVSIPLAMHQVSVSSDSMERVRSIILQSAGDALEGVETVGETELLLDDLEDTFTFALRFRVKSFRQCRSAASLVRKSLAGKLSFASRAPVSVTMDAREIPLAVESANIEVIG